MKTISAVVCLACIVVGESLAGVAGYLDASRKIQATCESDDQPTYINGTQYLCLSQRHVQMLRRQSRSET